MKRITKIISVFLAASMVFFTGCAQVSVDVGGGSRSDSKAEESHIYKIEKKTMPMYLMSDDEKIDVELVFLDGVTDVPYISVDTFKDLFETLMESPNNPDFAVSVAKDGENVTLTRETGYPAKISFDEDTIEFWDLDGFFRKTGNDLLIDNIDYPYFNEDGEPQYFEITDSFERYGQEVIINAGKYGIDLVHQDDGYYLPLHLVSDVFISKYDGGFIYNGSAVYAGGGGDFDGYNDLFYNKDYPAKRSPELARFNYNELCLALDYIYGLKSQHDIGDFDTMFFETGLKDRLLSEDPKESCQALYEAINVYLDDLHSGLLKNIYIRRSTLEGKHAASAEISDRDTERFATARAKYYGEVVPGYEEVGNTAYITFDGYVFEGIDYYTEKAEDHLDDTMGLLIYSFDQITRKDSPVENVVLDMSLNGGGAVRSAAYAIGMFIGDGSISIKNVTSNALVTQNFRADLNLDRKFDDNDMLAGKYNLICLTSPVSFSCGNLVPSVLKNSHEVMMMGQTSGGGTCIVQHLTTADGSILQISSSQLMSYTKNGSFYEIDRGVEPDHVISTPEQFYDREALTKKINDILGK